MDKSAARIAGTALGVALVVAAVWFAFHGLSRDGDASALGVWGLLRNADPTAVAGLFLAVIAHLLATSLVFWAVTLSFDTRPRVGLVRMTGLIAASSLLNYLPLRPGLVGRAGYLKLRHGLPLRQSLWITLTVLAMGAAVPAAAVLIVVGVPEGWRLVAGAAACAAGAAATPPLARLLMRRPIIAGWSWVPLRALELLLTGARFWLAFRLVGRSDITFADALMIGAAGFFVGLVGITPNGLGLREWAVAATAAFVQPASAPAGVLATLADRAVEAIVFSFAGLWALARLRRTGGFPAASGPPATGEKVTPSPPPAP